MPAGRLHRTVNKPCIAHLGVAGHGTDVVVACRIARREGNGVRAVACGGRVADDMSAYAPAIAGRSKLAEPLNGGSSCAVMRPATCASSVSLLMKLHRDLRPLGTMIAGSVSPRDGEGHVRLARRDGHLPLVMDTVVVWKVIVSVRVSMLAPAGSCSLSALTLAERGRSAVPSRPARVPAFCAMNCASDGSSTGAAAARARRREEEGIAAEGAMGLEGAEEAAGEVPLAPCDGEARWPVYLKFAWGWYTGWRSGQRRR